WNELEQQVVEIIRRGVMGPSVRCGDVTGTGILISDTTKWGTSRRRTDNGLEEKFLFGEHFGGNRDVEWKPLLENGEDVVRQE
ncbi:hypothetical protein A2U01_0040531, partial [Trifolium medium]|nr:hypothetical protein [Trifolium medium]